ncbi:MAG TPA: SGNH/GDSL hydrolase family protein [Verrucomicrobiae bacterium]|nr:SGNH/GDSL hydrolase family protein [Verrucomicrobiae bacterium]
MKKLFPFTAAVLLFGLIAFRARAGFSSIYVFGDSISATATNNATGSATNYYYGKRYCNGRSWVEVLAQRQGLGANSITNVNWNYSSNNVSFYGQYSPTLVTNVNKFIAPSNATNCLFVVWVCNADFVGDMNDPNIGAPNNSFHGTNLVAWTNAINQHLANHFTAITNLYAKGCRALIAPNAADITTVPEFNNQNTNYSAFVRQQIIRFNTNYTAMLRQIVAGLPDLKIYVPDIFTLLDNILTNAAAYGLTNAAYDQGTGNGSEPIDAIDAFGYGILPNANPNGPGTNYIFWDPLGDPSAKLQEIVADVTQQLLAPPQFSGISYLNGTNQLNLTNAPVGLNGLVLSLTNLATANWTTNLNFTATNPTQTISVSATNQQQFYRLNFPFAWTWP